MSRSFRPSLLIVALALLAGACSSGSSHAPGAAASGGKGAVRIGVSIQDLEAQFYEDMVRGMREQAAKYGYSLAVVDANRDNARQQSQVEDFISQHDAAIILTPYDSQAIGSAIAEANRAGVPVFTADIASTSPLGHVIAHVASDNVQGGYQAGLLMCAAVHGHGEIAIIDQPEVTSVQDRVRGFKQAIAQHCPAVRIVADVDAGGQRDKANSDMGDLLQAHPHLAGVFGINDDSALGALAAVQAAGLAGKIQIVGFDATPEARAAIAKGWIYGDAIQHPEEIGKRVIEIVHAYLTGKHVPARVQIPVGTFTRADATQGGSAAR